MAGSDTKAPYISKITPASGAKDIAIASDIVIDFSEPVVYGSGSIELVNMSAGTSIKIFANDKQLSLNGSTLTINPSLDLAPGSSFAINIDTGFVKDEADNLLEYSKALFYTLGVLVVPGVGDPIALPPQQGLQTGYPGMTPINIPGIPGASQDIAPPTVTSFSPPTGTTSVPIDANLVITFSENIQFGAGDIVLQTSDSKVVETFRQTSSNVSISGNTLTINPSVNFNYSTGYYVGFEANSVKDEVGNSYVGSGFSFTSDVRSLQATDMDPNFGFIEIKNLKIVQSPNAEFNKSKITFDVYLDSSEINGKKIIGLFVDLNYNQELIYSRDVKSISNGGVDVFSNISGGGDSVSNNEERVKQGKVLAISSLATENPNSQIIDSDGKVLSITLYSSSLLNEFSVGFDQALLIFGDYSHISAIAGYSKNLNINSPPSAMDALVMVDEDNTKISTLSATDVDSTSLTFAKVANPSNGTVTVSTNGTYTYTPNANFNGTDSFTFKANDGALDSAAATVSITVSAVNDLPVGTIEITGTAKQGETLTATKNFTDVDGIPVLGYLFKTSWLAGNTAITGTSIAVSQTGGFIASNLVLTPELVGKKISFTATYTDNDGTQETMTSAETSAVAGIATSGTGTTASAKFWKDNAKAPTATKKADAVNLTDAIAILKMIVGLNVNSNNTALSPYQAIAADFDQSGDVGLTDAIGVLKMVVGLSAPTPTWKYYDDTKLASAYTSAQSLNPKGWTTTAAISDTGTADSSVKLVGVLTGDVDGSWTGV